MPAHRNGPAPLRCYAAFIALINLAYVVVPVVVVAAAVADLTEALTSGALSGGESFLVVLATPALIGYLLVGLAIVSPVLTWLICLAVGLRRGRRWARIGGGVTFGLSAALFPAIGLAGDAPRMFLPYAFAFSAPSLAGLLTVLACGDAFGAARRLGPAQS